MELQLPRKQVMMLSSRESKLRSTPLQPRLNLLEKSLTVMKPKGTEFECPFQTSSTQMFQWEMMKEEIRNTVSMVKSPFLILMRELTMISSK